MPELVRAVAASLPRRRAASTVLARRDELSRLPGSSCSSRGRCRAAGAVHDPRAARGRAARRSTSRSPAATSARRSPDRTVACADADPRQAPSLATSSGSWCSTPRSAGIGSSASSAPRAPARRPRSASLADAHRQSDLPVLGAAPSGRAADELQPRPASRAAPSTGCCSTPHGEGGLPHGCVLVVDEAGMAETRVLAPLLELVEQAEGKAILVGDPPSCPPVGAGGLYPALCDQLGTIELDREPPPARPARTAALARLRAGDPEPYLAHAARHGRLHLDDDPISRETAAARGLVAGRPARPRRGR